MAQTSSGKRERGANYTAEEKTLFAGLVTQYKHIVEDKRTGNIFIRKKNEAWKAITDKYNSKCCTGRRGMAQLKALHDNMKQKARKTIGESNVEINKNGDSCYKPETTDSDSKILAIIHDKVDPLDSGALDFKDGKNLLEPTHSEPRSPEIEIGFSEDIKIIENQFTEPVEQSDSGNSIDLDINRGEGSPMMTHEADVTDLRKCQTNKSSYLVKRRLLNTTNGKKQKVPGILQKPLRNASAEELKRIYLKKKCQNANLERKKLIQEILQNKKQHRLKMLILKKKMENIS